jgi:hypothetical protein
MRGRLRRRVWSSPPEDIYEQAVVKGRAGKERDLFKHLSGVVTGQKPQPLSDASCHIIRCRPHSPLRCEDSAFADSLAKSSGRGPAVDPVLPVVQLPCAMVVLHSLTVVMRDPTFAFSF